MSTWQHDATPRAICLCNCVSCVHAIYKRKSNIETICNKKWGSESKIERNEALNYWTFCQIRGINSQIGSIHEHFSYNWDRNILPKVWIKLQQKTEMVPHIDSIQESDPKKTSWKKKIREIFTRCGKLRKKDFNKDFKTLQQRKERKELEFNTKKWSK